MDRFDNLKRKIRYGNPWFIVIIVILILSFLFMLVSNLLNRNLEVYKESDKVSEFEYTESKEETVGEMYDYTNKELGFTIKIPSDWKKIEENGEISFVHTASSSSIKISGSDYNPMVNNLDETTLSNEVSSNGYNFVSFKYLTTSSYELIYQQQQANIYDYMDETFWNQEKQVHLLCVFSDQNYKKIIPYYQKILESFQWNDEKQKIDENIRIIYLENMFVQFGLPENWTWEYGEDRVTAYDETTATNFFFTGVQMNRKQLTGVDVSNYLRENLDGFVMNSYDGDEKKSHAVFSYFQSDIQWIREAYIFAENDIAYFMVYDYQNGMLDSSIPETCQKYFKLFTPKDGEDKTDSTENTKEQTENTSENTQSVETDLPTENQVSNENDNNQMDNDITNNSNDTNNDNNLDNLPDAGTNNNPEESGIISVPDENNIHN